MKSLYEQLGITPQASQKAIQQSFFRLAKKFDPNNPANQGNAATREHYAAVQYAYRTLSDPEARADYDRGLQKQPLLHRAKKQSLLAKDSRVTKT